MEEGIAGRDIRSLEQPVVQHPLLLGRQVEPGPGLDATTEKTNLVSLSSAPSLLSDLGELIELLDVI